MSTIAANRSVSVGERKFYVNNIPARTKLALDARVCLCLAPVLDVMGQFTRREDNKVKLEFNGSMFGALKTAIMQILAGDQGKEFTSVVLELIGYTVYIQDGQPSVETAGNEDAIFAGAAVWDMYLLAYEVGRINKLSPFALLADGVPTTITG